MTQAGFELKAMVLLQLLECEDYSHEPLGWALYGGFVYFCVSTMPLVVHWELEIASELSSVVDKELTLALCLTLIGLPTILFNSDTNPQS